MQLVFIKKNYEVFYCKRNNNYIVVNTSKEFEQGHTHVNTYKQACYLVDCSLKKRIPKKSNNYFLTSLQRLSTDKKYIERLQSRLNDGEKKNYYNTPRNFRK